MKALSIALALVIGLQGDVFAAAGQKSFESLDDAVKALVAAFRAEDRKAIVEILGPKGVPIVWSGDNVADRAGFQRFVAAYDRKHRLEGGGGKVVLYVGDDDYPLPIPLVPDGPRWFWDTDAGDDEILYRRVGRNELATIQVCLAYVDAQREYYSRDRGAGILEYAQHLESTQGKRDGLYWPTRPGERQSPIGPLVAEARAAGYTRPEPGKRSPYNGYLFRLLLSQGPAAPGGAYDFVVKGHMIGGSRSWRSRHVRRLGHHDVHGQPRRHRVSEGPRAENRPVRGSDEDLQSRQDVDQSRVRHEREMTPFESCSPGASARACSRLHVLRNGAGCLRAGSCLHVRSFVVGRPQCVSGAGRADQPGRPLDRDLARRPQWDPSGRPGANAG
jgi:hypothetical protein